MFQRCVTPIKLFLLFFLFVVPSVTVSAQQENEVALEQKTTTEQQSAKANADEKKPGNAANDQTENANEQLTNEKRKIVAPINFLKQQQEDLKHYLEPDIVKPILVGMKEHVTLLEINKTSLAKGVLILLPDWQKNATGSKAINFLRQQLPKQGWTTITIQPPAKPSNYPSHAIEREKRIENNKKALVDYQDDLTLLLKQIHQQAKEYPGVIIVISEGSNGALLTNIYQQEVTELPTALILLSSFLPTIEDNKTVAFNITQLPIPVLDLTLFRDNINVKSAAQLRADAVKQEMKAYYRQKQLHNITPSSYPKALLIKEINGWLASLGW